jgi:plastocyanin
MKKIIIPLLLIVLGAGGYFVWKASTQTPSTNTTTQKKQVKPLPKEVTVTLDKEGFKPNKVTIQVGSAVRWKNDRAEKQTVNSDNYPTNRLHRELNFGVFNSGSSVVYVFTKPGTYGYHNQFLPEQKGQIIVTQ